MPLLLMVLLAPAALAWQLPDQNPVFRAGITLVRVDAQVTDRAGRTVPNLTAADFQVYDDGDPQQIRHFGHESEPLDVLLLLDVSGSMTRFLEEMAANARAALEPLGPQDRVGVMLFSRNAALRQGFTGDFGRVQDGIRAAVREGGLGSGTAINSAIIEAARAIAREPVRGRRAILIATDNQSLNYKVPDEEVIRALYAADAVLDVILIGKQRRPDAPRPGVYRNPDFTPSDTARLAEATGGEVVEARKKGRPFREMIERIRARYSLEYQPPPEADGSFHRINVELSAAARRLYPGATVRARQGYYAPPKDLPGPQRIERQ